MKEKRSIIKSMLAKLRNTFKVSAAEIDRQDKWQSAVIALATVSNSASHTQTVIRNSLQWIERTYPDAIMVKHDVEIL